MSKFPYKIIDLTHTLGEQVPSWNGHCGFKNVTVMDYSDCETEVKFRAQEIQMQAGIGTHMDAPAHCIPGGTTIHEIPLDELLAPCVVIDVSRHAHERYSASCEDVFKFEQEFGEIEPGSFVLIRTGWEQFWNTPEKYRNNHVFPSLSAEAARLLLERNIVGIGIDTLSPDRPEDGFPVHETLLGASKYIVENVAGSIIMPKVGGFILCLPMKIKDGTEAVVRMVGLI